MAEYGRGIQQMVEHCKTIANKDERTRCAQSIVKTMSGMVEHSATPEDFQKKLWNHLATIAQYELDIDYPVEIERMDDDAAKPKRIVYPQKQLKKRNYGIIVEHFADKLAQMDEGEERDALACKVANQMKRDLCNWNTDSMSDAKVADDLAFLTEGKVTLNPNCHLVSDGELLSTRISTAVRKKRKDNRWHPLS